jgi:hypothetical protein
MIGRIELGKMEGVVLKGQASRKEEAHSRHCSDTELVMVRAGEEGTELSSASLNTRIIREAGRAS